LTDESLDEPPRLLARARQAQGVADSAFFTLAIGQTRRLSPRKPRP
jgi:N-acyl-phosphatidylethanolamine-hydrolysing phospholipase D